MIDFCRESTDETIKHMRMTSTRESTDGPGYYMENIDVIDGLRKIPSKSTSMVVIDPPYEVIAVNKSINQPYEDIRWEQEVWDEVIRTIFTQILKADGHLVVFWQANERYTRHPDSAKTPIVPLLRMIRIAYNKLGLKEELKHYQIAWNKMRTSSLTSNMHADRPIQSFEHVYVFWMGTSTANWKGQDMTNVLNFYMDENKFSPLSVIQSFPQRFDVKPRELLRRLIAMFTKVGDLVVDPAMAKGATGAASLSMRRNFIGFDREESQYAYAKKRIEEEFLFGNCSSSTIENYVSQSNRILEQNRELVKRINVLESTLAAVSKRDQTGVKRSIPDTEQDMWARHFGYLGNWSTPDASMTPDNLEKLVGYTVEVGSDVFTYTVSIFKKIVALGRKDEAAFEAYDHDTGNFRTVFIAMFGGSRLKRVLRRIDDETIQKYVDRKPFETTRRRS